VAAKPDPRATAFRALNLIGIIAQLAQTALNRVLEDGLSLAGFSVLNHFVVRGEAGKNPAALAFAFQVTKGAMTNTLQRLEQKGYVEIAPDPADGRAKLVSVTRAGRTAHARALAAIAPEIDTLLGTIPSKDFAATLPFLTQLKDVLDAARD
jgi:DNA-binding MarR family transcriptional regulator